MKKATFRKITEIVEVIDYYFIIISCLIVPLYLLIYGINLKFRFPPIYACIPLFIGLLTLAIHIIYLALDRRSHLRKLWNQAITILQARSALSIGSGLACLVVGGYFLFPSDSNLASRYQGALGLYLSTLGTVLAIDIFYNKLAPITDMDTLLETISSDLESHPDNTRLWFVYPAINIGYYRTLEQCGLDDEQSDSIEPGKAYSIFRDALKEKVNRSKKVKPKAITFPLDLYKSLYDRYERVHYDIQNPRDTRIKECEKEARGLVSGFDVKEISPEKFPQHIIIIGNIVYTVMTYGFPNYDSTNKKFTEGEAELASLLVYRRDDALLANIISSHLDIIFSRN
jgi:hypothetical protein